MNSTKCNGKHTGLTWLLLVYKVEGRKEGRKVGEGSGCPHLRVLSPSPPGGIGGVEGVKLLLANYYMCMVQNESEHLSPATYRQRHRQRRRWRIAGNCSVFFPYFVPYFGMSPATQNVQFLIGLCFRWRLFGGGRRERRKALATALAMGRRGRKKALAMGRERLKEKK